MHNVKALRFGLFAAVLAGLTMIVGCGESRQSKIDRTTSQVRTQAQKEFNEANFQPGGKIGDKDAWGNDVTWKKTSEGRTGFYVEVRSNGPDGLPLTRDDITDRRWVSLADKLDKARSDANVIARKAFNETNFADGGGTGQKDPWGNEYTWALSKGLWSYSMEVRSNGPDGLPYTYDDITAMYSFSVPKGPDEAGVSERLVQGLTRGAIRGIKQGLKEKVTSPTDKK